MRFARHRIKTSRQLFCRNLRRRSFSEGDPDAVLAAGERPPVEPAVAREHLEAGLGEQRVPRARARATTASSSTRPAGPRTESVSVCAVEVPVGPLVDARLALDPAAVRLLDVLAGRREDVEDEPPAGPEQLAGGAERLEPLGVVRAGGDTRGTGTSRAGRARPPAAGAGRRAAGRAASATPASPRPARHRQPASRRTSRRRSRATPASAVGIAIRPGADAELDDRAARRERLVDVERDVLDRRSRSTGRRAARSGRRRSAASGRRRRTRATRRRTARRRTRRRAPRPRARRRRAALPTRTCVAHQSRIVAASSALDRRSGCRAGT